MNDPRREILNQVATGTITAEEGASRLEAMERGTGQAAPAPALPPTSGVRQIRLLARLGSADVVADPSVASAVADGPHEAHQEGDALVIEQSGFGSEYGFRFSPPRGFRIEGAPRLVVRMNPELALDAIVQAGNVRIDGVHGPITGDVQTGNCKISGFTGPLNLVVSAGNVSAQGRLTGGSSTVRCDMGSVRLALDKTSSVRIRARSTMGKVSIAHEGVVTAEGLVVGSGAGSLDVDCTMGSVRVSVE